MSYARRLQSECKHYKESVAEGVTLEPDELSLLDWHCTIQAPDDTPYDKRVFDVRLKLPEDYPMHPPKAYFASPIFHPNIHFVTGEVCLDILKSRWTPVWNLESVCLAIQVLLANPDPSSPLNCDAAVLLRSGDEAAYASLARAVHWTVS
ncbi:hypothetical protein WA577_006259 [Blastocystis sp. JDR]